MEWSAWQMVLLVLPFMALVVACSQTRHTDETQPVLPTCESLLGKPLPAAVADSGCADGATNWIISGFACTDGSTLDQWGRWYADPIVRHYSGPADPAYLAAYRACV
jgi:hypothetical protein